MLISLTDHHSHNVMYIKHKVVHLRMEKKKWTSGIPTYNLKDVDIWHIFQHQSFGILNEKF